VTRRVIYPNNTATPVCLKDSVSVCSPSSALQAEIRDAFQSWGSDSDKNAIEKQIQEWWRRYGCKLPSREFVLCFTQAIQSCYPRDKPPSDDLLRLAFACLCSLDAIKKDELDKIVEIEFLRLQAYYHPNDPVDVFPWLKACFNVTGVSALYFQIYGLNREEEMRSIVFDAQGTIRSCFWKGELRYRVMRLVDWFLRRYDLSAAFAVLRSITFNRAEPNKVIQHGVGQDFWRRTGKMLLLVAALLSFLFVPTTGRMGEWWPELAAWVKWMPLPHSGEDPWTQPHLIDTWRLFIYPLGSVLLFLIGVFFCWYWRKRRFDNLYRLLPRLVAGILVGYVPLMSAGDPWKWLLRMPLAPAVGLWLLMLLVSLGYLYVEARNTLTEGKLSAAMQRELWIRVLHVFFVGLSEALVIGFILSELFGETVLLSLLDDIEGTQVIAITGWIGYIFPKVILLYAPLALFLGILVQLIWEEKAVTQPL